MKDFLDLVNQSLNQASLVKITLSKPRLKSAEYKNLYFRPVTISEKNLIQVVRRTRTQDFTDNIRPDELMTILKPALEDQFFNASLLTTDYDHQLLQSKKGKAKIISKKSSRVQPDADHDRKKVRFIDATSSYLQDLGITSSKGMIYGHAKDKFKQINKYIEIIDALTKGDRPNKIYDMGSGKGYLTFALYDHLKSMVEDLEVTGVEVREDLIDKCNDIAQKHQFNQLKFQLGSIDAYPIDRCDMVVALHACDIATDMAIAKGIEAKAKYIVLSPCCHKQIRKGMKPIKSTLSPLLSHGILMERQAEMITDGIRALILESIGYKTKIFEFISSEHTGKNIMITATYTGKVNTESKSQIEALKREFGISEHYLETLIVK